MSQLAEKTEPAEPVLLRGDSNGIATLTLNRPAQRNSLSEALMTALSDELRLIAEDKNVRVVVIAANGPAFSAGHDLKEMTARRQDADRGRRYYQNIMRQCSALMQSIVRLPKPVIARVHGIATAAGCQLVASCDLAIAAEGSQLRDARRQHRALLFDADGGAVAQSVAQACDGNAAAGEMIDAVRAAEFGLINKVVPAGQLDAAVLDFAGKIASKSALTVSIGKEAFYHQLEKGLSEAYDYASDAMVKNMLARDAEEGIGAFIEKREPKWEDR